MLLKGQMKIPNDQLFSFKDRSEDDGNDRVGGGDNHSLGFEYEFLDAFFHSERM